MTARKIGQRLAVALPFCAILIFIDFPFCWALSLVVIVSALFARAKFTGFLWVNAMFMLTTAGLFAVTVNLQSPYPAPWDSVVQAHDPDGTLPKWLALAVAILVYFLVFWLLQRAAGVLRGQFALRFVAATLLAFVFAYDGLRGLPVVNLLLFAVTLAIAKSFWFLCCNFRDQALLKHTPVLSQFLLSCQPWQQGLAKACVAAGFDITNDLKKDEPANFKSDLGALYLVIWAAVLAKAAFYLEEWTIGTNGYLVTLAPPFDFLPVPLTRNNYLQGHLSVGCSWLFIGLKCFIFLTEMAAYTHAAVAIGRMLGIHMEKNVDRPYRSRSFTDFLKRIYYYYISFLNQLIFYPLWARLGMINHKRTRIFLVTFITISLGGLITTTLGNVYGVMTMSAWQFIASVLGNFPYFILLGLFAGMSSLFRPAGARPPHGLVLLARSFCYFWMYTICFSTELGRSEFDIATRLSATLHLFGF